MYAVILIPDDNGAVLATCPDLPEVTTFGDDKDDAMQRAADAIEEALAARISYHEDIPDPSIVEIARAQNPEDREDATALAQASREASERSPLAKPGYTVSPTSSAGRRRDRVARLLCIPDAAQMTDADVQIVQLPPLTVAKVELYRAARTQGVSKAELARRLGWHSPQVDRLFDLNHRSAIEQIDQALRAIGKRLVVSVQNAA